MADIVKPRTILELIKITENLFSEKSIASPRLNAELLMANVLKTERINLYLEFDKPLDEHELNSFRDKVKRRLNMEPLQYITGEAYFYGRRFNVNPAVLIPRPETEMLVEKTLEKIRENMLENPRILEIGTGSGCISISIAANVPCLIDAIDVNSGAIDTAKKNAESNGVSDKINFYEYDFLSADISLDKYDIVISNPPYIPAIEFEGLAEEIKDYEPVSALTDSGDGLEFYRRVFTLYNTADTKPVVIMETGDGKKERVEEEAKKFAIENISFYKDLIGIYRVIIF